MTTSPVGFLGIGAMGRPMAINLTKAGLPVVVSDPNPVATGILAQHGARVVESARAVADAAAVVHLCLPSVAIAEAVAAEVAKGSAVKSVVNHGTTGSAYSKAAAKALAEKGIAFLDAPISGGVAGAEAGSLAIMCSGDAATFEAAKPALEAMSGQLTYLGEAPGAAQTMKLCNNILFFCNLAATCETMTLGTKAGLDPEQMLAIMNKATGRNFATEQVMAPFVLSRSFDFGGANYIIQKDLELWRQEAEAYEVPSYIATLVRTLFRQMIAEEGEQEDASRIALLMERMAGSEIKKLS
ncbi:MAG: NAD(P)-dependent oxidoreductase [Alphaproteobacteria bacterium]|nr:NAD(P)-dependent oxidoreductase [Alphaproteobacteria bacterium]MCB9930024.1 NAD(P)-dependent oxidoreductase [Alphaproteobacteria bacterium]